MNDKLYFYANHVAIESEADLEDATNYMVLWKKFFIENLKRVYDDVEFVDESFIYRPKYPDEHNILLGTVAIKIAVIIPSKEDEYKHSEDFHKIQSNGVCKATCY